MIRLLRGTLVAVAVVGLVAAAPVGDEKLGKGVTLTEATPLKALYDEGKVAVMQGIGYPNPIRSHFRSMDIWHTAEPT